MLTPEYASDLRFQAECYYKHPIPGTRSPTQIDPMLSATSACAWNNHAGDGSDRFKAEQYLEYLVEFRTKSSWAALREYVLGPAQRRSQIGITYTILGMTKDHTGSIPYIAYSLRPCKGHGPIRRESGEHDSCYFIGRSALIQRFLRICIVPKRQKLH